MAKFNPEEEDFNVWPTYSDVAFAIVLILIFIILAQYVVLSGTLQFDEIQKMQKVISEKLQQTFPGEYGEGEKYSIFDTKQPQLQKITFSNRILFDSGSAVLKNEGKRYLRGVANILIELQGRRVFDEIQIRGHTDPRRIRTARFPSNWELSSARATSVVRYFVDVCNLKPNNAKLLLSAQGFAEFDPREKNDTEANMALNRRIEVIIKYPLAY